MPICCHIKFVHTRLSTKNTFLQKQQLLAVHEEPEHIAIFAHTVPHGWFYTYQHAVFLLIDRSVWIIQNNQMLAVLIKYIANYL